MDTQPATSKQELMQAVMRDTSLTPQEKQKKIQQIMAGGPAPAAQPAAAVAPTPEPPRTPEPPQRVDPTPQSQPPAKPAMSKQELMQAVMRDTSLTPQEKQKKIQQIMAGGPATAASPPAAQPVAAVAPAPEPPRAPEPPQRVDPTPQSQPPAKSATSKQELMQAVMRDSSLTPQEKQKKIQQIMAEETQSAVPAVVPAAHSPQPPSGPTPTPESQTQQEGSSQENADGQDGKRQAIQAIMRDSSLTPQEKQKKIQEFMASGGHTPPVEASGTPEPPQSAAPAPSQQEGSSHGNGDDQDAKDGQDAKRQAIQAIMRDPSLTPQEKQKKIQAFMASGGEAAAPPSLNVPPTSVEPKQDAVGPAPATSPSGSVLNREAMQAVMRDSSLTPQEKQQRIQQIMANGNASSQAATAPGVSMSTEGSQHGKSSGRVSTQSSQNRTAAQGQSLNQGGGVAQGAVSSTGADSAARKSARPSRVTAPGGSTPPAAAAGRQDDPAARKIARASRPARVGSGQESGVLDKTSPQPPSIPVPQAQGRSDASNGFSRGNTGGGRTSGFREENPPSSGDNFDAPRSAPIHEEMTPALPPLSAIHPPRPPIQPETYAGLNYTTDIAGADTGGIQAYVAGEGDNAVEAGAVVTEQEIEASERKQQTRCTVWFSLACLVVLLVIVITPAVVVPKKNKGGVYNFTDAPSQAPSSSPTGTTYNELKETLRIVYGNDEEYEKAFADEDTPQSRAAFWAADEDPHGISGNDPRMISRYALASFYFSTNGDDWTRCGRQSTSCNAEEEWLTAPNECDWNSIICTDPDNGDFSVKEIFFTHVGNEAGNNINGTLPFELGLLSNLQRIVLSRQVLKGSFPDWSRLSTLKELFIGGNELTGTFPEFLIKSIQMLVILIENNKLTGPLPLSVSSESLEELNLSGNGFSGPIPAGISGFPSLKKLLLSDTGLSGAIPEELYALTDLISLDLSNNLALNDIISDSVANLSNLLDLNALNSGLSGTLPSGLFDLSTLKKLRLSACSFSGTLSESFSKLTSLVELNLNNNTFTGTIPEAFELLGSLKTLELHSNDITGRVSDGLCAKTGDGFFDLTYLTADCLGDTPEVRCACCDNCPQR